VSYFDENYQKPKKPSYMSYIAVAVICSVLSSMLSLALAPKIFKNLATAPNNSPTVATVNKGDTGGATQLSTADLNYPVVNISKTVGPAVVGIANFQSGKSFNGGNLQEAGSGSGIIIDANKGYILTNDHVVAGAEKLVISLSDGRTLDGKLVGEDARTDLAVLQVSDTKGLVAAEIGDSTTLQVGEPVVAIGNPGGEQFARSVTTGIVSALNRILQLTGESSFNLIQTDAAINPGNSGGALVDLQGKVVGINSAKNNQTGFEGMGFAIPISDAWPVVTQLIQSGHASHVGMFVSINDSYNENYAQARGIPAGAMVANVSPNGPAAKGGVQAGDIITSIDDKTIKNYYDLTHELFKHKVGDTVKLAIYRNGTKLNVEVALAELTN
jgi:serine protease Do